MENNKLSTVLWILSSFITTTVILLVNIGSGLAILFGASTLISLLGWFRYSYKKPIKKNITIGIYLLTIVLLMVLYTIRYASKYSDFISSNYSDLFIEGLVFDHTSWFVWMVCLPITTFLFGGYLISKSHFAGSFFAWFALVFAVIEAFIQMSVELTNVSSYNHWYYAGVLISMALFYNCVYGIISLVRIDEVDAEFKETIPLTQRKKNLWTILFIAFMVVYSITVVSTAGKLPLVVIVGSMVCGLIGWRLTTANHPADPQKFLPLYLLLQTLFFIHLGEEVLTHFNRDIALISGIPWSDTDFDYLITFFGPILWIYAAYSLWKGEAFGNFILWFMIAGMILGEPTHILVFPLVKMAKFGGGYEYFSGMYTSLFPMIPAILAIPMLISDYKKHKTNA